MEIEKHWGASSHEKNAVVFVGEIETAACLVDPRRHHQLRPRELSHQCSEIFYTRRQIPIYIYDWKKAKIRPDEWYHPDSKVQRKTFIENPRS